MASFKYSRNPLIQVIMQIRFPSLLEISNKDPVEFQQKIRTEFPLYDKNMEKQQQITIDTNAPTPKLFEFNTINHKFSSENNVWAVNLTNTFLSISTTHYESYEDMKDKFNRVVSYFNELYKPAFCTRLGLRYIDAISRKKYNLMDTPWKDLLDASALGFLANTNLSEQVSGLQNISEIAFSETISSKVITSLAYVNGDMEEKQFVFDSDTFTTDRVNIEDLLVKLDILHENSFRLFDSIIKDNLREAMK